MFIFFCFHFAQIRPQDSPLRMARPQQPQHTNKQQKPKQPPSKQTKTNNNVLPARRIVRSKSMYVSKDTQPILEPHQAKQSKEVPARRDVRRKSEAAVCSKRKAKVTNQKNVYTSIKMSLRRGLRRGLRHANAPAGNVDLENRQAFMRQIEYIEMTKCMKLGSLNIHCCLMATMATNNPQTIHAYFN